MTEPLSPAAPAAVPAPPAGAVPWRAMLVSVAILALQIVAIDRLVGEETLALTGTLFGRRFLRKELLIAVLAAAVVLQHVVRRNLDTFRLAPLDPTRLAAQSIPFLALLGFMATIPTGLPQSLVGTTATDAIATVLLLAWIASALLLLPHGADVRRAAAAAATAAAAVAGAIAISDRVTNVFWVTTGGVTVDVVERLLVLVVADPVVRPSKFVIGTEAFQVRIHSPCSGYQGITLVTMLFAAYLWWFRAYHRFPRALVIFPVGVVLVYLANIVRIIALILVGIHISPEIAVDGFHSQAGWVAFLVIGLGTIWVVSRMPYFTTLPAGDTAEADRAVDAAAAAPLPAGAKADAPRGALHGPSVVACLLPYLALLATQILTGLFSTKGSLDLLYPARVAVVAAVLWRLRGELRPRSWSVSPVAVGIGVAVCAAWMALAGAFTAHDSNADPPLDPMQLGAVWGPVWLVVRLVGYVVTVPIAEELAFRGFLTRRLIAEDVERVAPGTFTWLSFVVSSAVFGIYHGADWLPATIAGAGFALALVHRGRIGDAIVAHATTNGLIAASVIATGRWSNFG